MARTIEQIKSVITNELNTRLNLSQSAVAEWRMWVHCMSVCIYVFEVILDAFKREMEQKLGSIIPGTIPWYREICYNFQFGYEIKLDGALSQLAYEIEDLSAKIIKIATVTQVDRTLVLRVATQNEQGKIIPLSELQQLDFKNYIDAIKFAGTKTNIISSTPDLVKYTILIYYNPSYPQESIRSNVLDAFDGLKKRGVEDGYIYSHLFINSATQVPGVTAVKIVTLQRKGTYDEEFIVVDTRAELYSGYFDYTDDCVIELKSMNDL